jgi:hypothetical protein
MVEIFSHKAIDMTLVDWFATFSPEPNEKEIQLERMYDLNKAHHNDKFIVRGDRQIRCELRYKWAIAMMKARGSYG